jgi:pyruvate/2-oxoglutarate/acetoin dehydrogenase E1 component
MLYVRALNTTLRTLLERDPRVVLLGEDLVDPYGGAFKVTRGLSSDFPARVLSTPVSEAAIAGMAGGLALGGFRPIVEFMFGDFATLAFDQIVNHVAKFGAMYDDQISCPVIFRTPMGGGRSYGPTHSQSLEKVYCGVPGLVVAAASIFQPPTPIFEAFLAQGAPAFFVEHKLMYGQETRFPDDGHCGFLEAEIVRDPGALPTVCLRPVTRGECRVTAIAYGHAAATVVGVAERLAVERELFVEVVIPAQIAPLDWTPIEASAAATGRVVICEEGTSGWSWGAEIAAELQARLFGRLQRPIRRVASDCAIIPSAPTLEHAMLFGAERACAAIRDVAR